MAKKSFTNTAYKNTEEFIFGKSIYPVTLKNNMIIGGGTVYPEINFTLPPMLVTRDSMPEVIRNYREIITGICERAKELYVPGFIAEIETLPPMTFNPEWGIEVCKTVVDVIKEYEAKYGVKGAVRITPNDIREGGNLEHMWHGRHWDAILETFEGCAKAGADFLAIESIGGKEVHDEAIMYCDIKKSIFALSVLACSDMEHLWTEITRIAEQTGPSLPVIPPAALLTRQWCLRTKSIYRACLPRPSVLSALFAAWWPRNAGQRAPTRIADMKVCMLKPLPGLPFPPKDGWPHAPICRRSATSRPVSPTCGVTNLSRTLSSWQV